MPPVEAWEKVFIKDQKFTETIHGSLGCINCHGGQGGVVDMDLAHTGVVRSPDSATSCVPCHSATVASDANSLHSTLAGYYTILYARSEPANYPQLDEMMDNHCVKCHTTCGQCHVSRPANLGGGFVAGHEFRKVPPMNLTCTGCHGSRVNDEYKGLNEGVPADVHWLPGGMACFACHSGDQMHGALGEKEHRYDGPPTPDCLDCHTDVQPGDGNPQHSAEHLELLSCSVCHANSYKNCYSCHVQLSEEGVPFFRLEKSEMNFKIGLNPLRSEDRPWKYVPLRHAPIAPDVFSYYGDDLLTNFDALPTWKYATPHNITKATPQNSSCLNCHDNPDVFLTEEDVLPELLEANKDVIVRDIPSLR